MFTSVLVALSVIVPVALLTGALVYLRPLQLVEPTKIEMKGVEAAAREYAFASVLLTLAAGLLVTLLYVGLAYRYPDSAAKIYLMLGVVLAAALSMAAAIVRPRLHMRGVFEIILLNILWGVSFGWLLPLVISA